MHRIYNALAIAVLVAFGPVASASAQQQKQKQLKPAQRPPVILHDRSIYGPPPPPHERYYYGPAPTIQPPMERVPLPAPLAPPPTR